MLNPRLVKLKKSIMDSPRYVDIERATLITESHQVHQHLSPVLIRAYALKNILEKHILTLDENDSIAGNRTKLARSGVISPEMSPYWIRDEIDQFETRPQDKFIFTSDDKEVFLNELFPYWQNRSLKDYYLKHVSPEVVNASKTKIFAINQTDKGQGHIIPSYERLLKLGFAALLEEVQHHLHQQPQNDFYQAACIVLEASIQYILRNKQFIDEQLEVCTDEYRQQELISMSECLAHIATNPARNLQDAIQLFWLQCIILQHESNASSISVGRFDQYMYPYFIKETHPQKAIDLLQNLYIKMNTIVFIRSQESAKFFAGFPSGYTMMISGLNTEGKDATNKLSHLLLKLHEDVALPQPNLSVRVHRDSTEDMLSLSAEMIRLGHGLPQLFSDEVNIKSFMNRNITLSDARDYGVVGCVELSIPHRMYGLHDIAMFNLLKCLEITMKQNNCTSYEQLIEATKQTIRTYVTLMVEGSNTCDLAHRECAPTPFLSIFMDGCMEKGLDVSAGGTIYNFSGVQGIGCPNLSDSLYVIKRAVFEENKLSYPQLISILEQDYANDESLRQMFIHHYPKYGNDQDEVDMLGSELLSYYCHEVANHKNIRGGYFQPGSYTVSAHIPLGEAVNATADGRKAHEQLADGGLSAMVGRDLLGPTATMMSVSKLDNYLTSNGSLLNLKFSPSVLKGDTGLTKLVSFIRAYNRLDIQHIQFNVQSRETLLDAQLHPEKYKHLIVRVAGYSAMFNELSKAIQDDIIARQEHQL